MFDIELKINSTTKLIESATDVGDALCKIFNYPSDVIAINILDYPMELPICHAFSDLLEDFLNIINDVNSDAEGSGTYGFGQNDFFDSDWRLEWGSDGILKIDFEWRDLKGAVLTQSMPRSIKIKKEDFIYQWKKIFRELQQKLSGVQLEYDDEYVEIRNFIG